MDLCLECDLEVRPLQHAVTCDQCDRWQHRICGTGITQREYFSAKRNGELTFTCSKCAGSESDQLHSTVLEGCNHGKTTTRNYQWLCSIRNSKMTCGASVNQSDGTKATYVPGKNNHCHPPDPLVSKRIKIKKQVKETGKERLFDSANRIVEDELLQTIEPGDFRLPKPASLLRYFITTYY